MQKSDLWRRWKAGQSLHEIGRAFGKSHSSIRCVVSLHGGFVPAVRRRSRLARTLAEREDISRGIASGSPLREITRRLDRAASTVSRETSRHGGRPAYRAHAADHHAWDSALRSKKCLLAVNRKLRNIVASRLMLDWSPEQISGWLKMHYADDESMRVSHETVYSSLFIQARGVLKKSCWTTCDRSGACAARDMQRPADSHVVKSSMPSRSVKGLRKWKTERFLAIGKAIC